MKFQIKFIILLIIKKTFSDIGVCGSTYFQKLFALENFGEANFGRACILHDECYNTCKSNRDLCDFNFDNDMKKQCDFNRGFTKVFCNRVRVAYFIAVNKYGQSAYDKAQIEYCPKNTN